MVYIVRCKIDTYDHIVTYSTNGNLLIDTKVLKRNSEIPESVLKSVKSLYAGYEIRDARSIEEKGKTIYRIRLTKSREWLYQYFAENGEIVKID